MNGSDDTTFQRLNDLFARCRHNPAAAPMVSADDRARLMALGRDLAQAWDSPGVSTETRKKVIRLLVTEIIVDVPDDNLALIIHWQGGDHIRLIVRKNKVGQTRWTIEGDTLDLVRVLARQMPDLSVAAILNRAGKRTGKDNSWTRSRVCSLRNTHGIAPYRDGERAERGEATLDETAGILQVNSSAHGQPRHVGSESVMQRSTLDHSPLRHRE